MKLYRDGMETNADKAQLKVMLDAGWSIEPSIVNLLEDPLSEKEQEKVKEVKVVVPQKKVRKPKKISIKE